MERMAGKTRTALRLEGTRANAVPEVGANVQVPTPLPPVGADGLPAVVGNEQWREGVVENVVRHKFTRDADEWVATVTFADAPPVQISVVFLRDHS